jgi:hypothetical protein
MEKMISDARRVIREAAGSFLSLVTQRLFEKSSLLRSEMFIAPADVYLPSPVRGDMSHPAPDGA